MAKKRGAPPRHFLKAWRTHRGLTQDQLAERLNVTREYISMIERGVRPYDQKFLEAAADAMMCAPADLLMRDPSQPGFMWSIWDQLPAEKREIVEDMVTGLVRGKKTGTSG